MSKHWVRFRDGYTTRFGSLEGDRLRVCEGDMFTSTIPTGQVLQLADVKLLMPVQPSKVIALWNNFKALDDKLQLPTPPDPLYLLKAPNSWLNPGEVNQNAGPGGENRFRRRAWHRDRQAGDRSFRDGCVGPCVGLYLCQRRHACRHYFVWHVTGGGFDEAGKRH